MRRPRILAYSVSALIAVGALIYSYGLAWDVKGDLRRILFHHEWPHSKYLIQHVRTNRLKFDELASRISETGQYFAVVIAPNFDSGLCAIRSVQSVCANYSDPHLLTLLSDLSMSEMGAWGDGVRSVIYEQHSDGQYFAAMLIRHDGAYADRESCPARMSVSGTGECLVSAGAKWAILYQWVPVEY